MNSLREVTIEINDAQNFHNLFGVYEELAAQKMQAIRDEILSFREYYTLLTSISTEIGSDISTVIKKHAKQRVAVLVSSDKGLYGSAFNDTVKTFLEHLEIDNTDAFVVGTIGDELLKAAKVKKNYTVIPTDSASLKNLWTKIGEYQEINIFYLKFNSIARQNADIVHLAGDIIPQSQSDYTLDNTRRLAYLYEPSAFEISELFAHKVLSFLAEQTMKECDLAKYAARLMYLDSCIEKNKLNLRSSTQKRIILSKRQQNKRQNARTINFITRSRDSL